MAVCKTLPRRLLRVLNDGARPRFDETVAGAVAEPANDDQ